MRVVTSTVGVLGLLLLAASFCAVGSEAVSVGRRAALPRARELTLDYSYDEFLASTGTARRRGAEPAALQAERQAIFARNLARAIQHNSNPAANYTMGVNKFSDWTEEELRHAGVLPNESMQRLAAAAAAGLDTNAALRRAATRAGQTNGRNITRAGFDWRTANPPVLTTIKDQGLCGACWAHATTESVESRHAIKNGVLNALSQQQLVSCAPNVTYTAHLGNQSVTSSFNTCNGYLPNLVLNWITTDAAFGPGNFVELWQNPYQSFFVPEAGSPNIFNITGGPPNPQVPACSAWMPELPPLAVVSGYQFVNANDVEAFERALIDHGPIISVISLQCIELAYYEGGIFSCPACEGAVFQPSHVINIVGFGEDRATGQSYWVVRNSWGGDWGENGYIRLARNTNKKGGEDCGTMVLPNDLNDVNGEWGYQPACGMCGLLAFGVVPDVQ